jgi:hypothetical protein
MDGGDGSPSSTAGFGPLIEFATRVLAPAGVLSAVLYYFGYVREQALFAYFGTDLGSLGFSTTDYLVGSAGTFFVLLATLLLAAVGAVVGHHLLQYLLSRAGPGPRRVIWIACGAAGVVLLAFGVIGLYRRGHPLLSPLAAPCALGAGVVLLEYVASAAAAATRATAATALPTALGTTGMLRRALAGALVLVTFFWLAANVALQHGVAAAHAIELTLPTHPQAVVFSHDRLQISGPGVNVVPLDPAGAAFAFRYNGLRTLRHSGGRWFLLPVGWTHQNGATVILLRDSSEGIRVDLAP